MTRQDLTPEERKLFDFFQHLFRLLGPSGSTPEKTKKGTNNDDNP